MEVEAPQGLRAGGALLWIPGLVGPRAPMEALGRSFRTTSSEDDGQEAWAIRPPARVSYILSAIDPSVSRSSRNVFRIRSSGAICE